MRGLWLAAPRLFHKCNTETKREMFPFSLVTVSVIFQSGRVSECWRICIKDILNQIILLMISGEQIFASAVFSNCMCDSLHMFSLRHTAVIGFTSPTHTGLSHYLFLLPRCSLALGLTFLISLSFFLSLHSHTHFLSHVIKQSSSLSLSVSAPAPTPCYLQFGSACQGDWNRVYVEESLTDTQCGGTASLAPH